MSIRPIKRRFIAWLSMLAMVFGALTPALGQAMLATGVQGDWIEVCTVNGMVKIKADAGAGAASDHQSEFGAGSDCSWCHLHCGAALLPVSDRLKSSDASPDVAAGDYRSPGQLRRYSPAQSRAPPPA